MLCREDIYSVKFSPTCFGRRIRPSSGALFDCIYSFWYNAPTLLPTGATVEMERRSISIVAPGYAASGISRPQFRKILAQHVVDDNSPLTRICALYITIHKALLDKYLMASNGRNVQVYWSNMYRLLDIHSCVIVCLIAILNCQYFYQMFQVELT